MGSCRTQVPHRRPDHLGGFVTKRCGRSASGAAKLVYRILRALVHAGNRVFNRSLPGLCALAKYGSNCAGQSRRDSGIFEIYLVVHDVRRRYRRWHLTYSTAEPIFHFTTNPETIQGLAQSQDADNVRNAYKWALLHYGLTPWACYGIVGMALG